MVYHPKIGSQRCEFERTLRLRQLRHRLDVVTKAQTLHYSPERESYPGVLRPMNFSSAARNPEKEAAEPWGKAIVAIAVER